MGPSALAALLIFAAVHGNLLQALYAFILGALLVWAYERFAKLTTPIILHVSANLYPFLYSKAHGLAAICRHMQWLPVSLVFQEQLQELCILQFTNKPETIAPRGFHEQ